MFNRFGELHIMFCLKTILVLIKVCQQSFSFAFVAFFSFIHQPISLRLPSGEYIGRCRRFDELFAFFLICK